jgi:hypothetical protein
MTGKHSLFASDSITLQYCIQKYEYIQILTMEMIMYVLMATVNMKKGVLYSRFSSPQDIMNNPASYSKHAYKKAVPF